MPRAGCWHRSSATPSSSGRRSSASSSAAWLSLGSQHIERLTATSAQNWSPLFRTRGYGYLDARDPRAVVESDDLEVLFAEDTRYHRLAVVDDADTRYLRFDNSLQSAMYREQPYRTRYRYTDFFHLGIAYNPDARNVLFVGLGAGSSEKRMWHDFPQLRLHAVELDPVVVDVASIYKTYRTAFPSVLVHPAILDGDAGEEQFRNLILVATTRPPTRCCCSFSSPSRCLTGRRTG